MNNYEYKKESIIILCCIIIIILFYCIYFMFNKIIKHIEMFSNSDSKREKMKKIYKSNDVSDPDEVTVDNPYDDMCDDPDGDCSRDPD